MTVSNKHIATKGFLWSTINKFGVMFITFLSNVVLARLLMPEDYGCIGMLMVFIALSNTFLDAGFGSALIQKKHPTDLDYSTIFYCNMILSIILYVILFLSSSTISSYYNLPLLKSVLRVQGLVLILNSLSLVQQNRLRKYYNFKKLAIVNILASLLSLSITIVVAYQGYGVWALVTQQLLLSGISAIIFWVISGWTPKLIFSLKSFKELFNFGFYILLSNLINTFCNNVQGLLLGKFSTARNLGFYTQSVKLVDVSSMTISSIVDQVSYPLLSENQDNMSNMTRVLKKITTMIAYISFPLMAIMILLAEAIIMFLFSEKWIEIVPSFRVLCCAGFFMSIININYYGVAALGKSKSLFIWTIVKRILGLICIVLGFLINDYNGLLWGFVFSALTVYLINALLSSYHIGYKLINQIKDISPVVLLTLISFLFVLVEDYYLLNEMSLYLSAIIKFISFISAYILLSYFFRLKMFNEILLMCKNIRNEIIKKSFR